jgi:hypothetical protein
MLRKTDHHTEAEMLLARAKSIRDEISKENVDG